MADNYHLCKVGHGITRKGFVMAVTSSVEVFDVGLAQLRQMLNERRVISGAPMPELGDYVLVFSGAVFGRAYNHVCVHETCEDHIKSLDYMQDVADCIEGCNLIDLTLGAVSGFHYEIWHVVDDRFVSSVRITDYLPSQYNRVRCAVCGDLYGPWAILRGPLGYFYLCEDCEEDYVMLKTAGDGEVR